MNAAKLRAHKIQEHKKDPLQLAAEGVMSKAEALAAMKEVDAARSEKQSQPIPDATIAEIEIDFNEYSLQPPQAELLFQYLLGTELSKALDVLYSGRSVPKLGGFRRSLHEAFENGGFVVDPADKAAQPRTGNDENIDNPIYRRTRALLTYELLVRLQDHARPLRLSNVSALRIGLKAALDRLAL